MYFFFFKENTELQLSKHVNNYALLCLDRYIIKHIIIYYLYYSLFISNDSCLFFTYHTFIFILKQLSDA